jgi:hypothetical protein
VGPFSLLSSPPVVDTFVGVRKIGPTTAVWTSSDGIDDVADTTGLRINGQDGSITAGFTAFEVTVTYAGAITVGQPWAYSPPDCDITWHDGGGGNAGSGVLTS